MKTNTERLEETAVRNNWKTRQWQKLLKIAEATAVNLKSIDTAVDTMLIMGSQYTEFMKKNAKELQSASIQEKDEMLDELLLLM